MATDHETTEPTPRGDLLISTAIVAALLFVPAGFCFANGVLVLDPDYWWHLSAGEWILQNRAFPTVDQFSSYGAGQPWTAYSWLPELMLYGLYQTWGLRGVVAYSAVLSMGIIAALHALIGRLQPKPLVSVSLTSAALVGLAGLFSPRPWLFTLLLLIVELDLLLTATRTGNRRLLLWLLPLFCLWANAHIQFMVGLAVLAAAVAEPVLARFFPAGLVDDDSRGISFGWMLLIFVLSVAATLVNPYHYHLYEVAGRLLGQKELRNWISELTAMPFRSLVDWSVLAITLAATYALGRRRRVRLLLPMLMLMAVYFGFRSQRDTWLVAVIGLATLAYVLPRKIEVRGHLPRTPRRGLLGTLAVLFLAGFLTMDEAKLKDQLDAGYPAGAVEFIRHEQLMGPIFNEFAWGGYLIYQMPELPVGIDGRTMVHGQERLLRHFKTLRGRDWSGDRELTGARLVILPAQGTLASLLRLDPGFELLYEDSTSVVLGPVDRLVSHEVGESN
jgi:hypothetical protein